MTTKQIIYVPGKNPEPGAPQHRKLLWRALLEGVLCANGAVGDTLQADYPDQDMCDAHSWNIWMRRLLPSLVWLPGEPRCGEHHCGPVEAMTG